MFDAACDYDDDEDSEFISEMFAATLKLNMFAALAKDEKKPNDDIFCWKKGTFADYDIYRDLVYDDDDKFDIIDDDQGFGIALALLSVIYLG
jgi:hypothetical protein